MSWYMLADGWRDESTEGPCDELQSRGPWTVSKCKPHYKASLTNSKTGVSLKFDTVEEAKAHAEEEDPTPEQPKAATERIEQEIRDGKRISDKDITWLLNELKHAKRFR